MVCQVASFLSTSSLRAMACHVWKGTYFWPKSNKVRNTLTSVEFANSTRKSIFPKYPVLAHSANVKILKKFLTLCIHYVYLEMI